ncbi:MAG TPA: adenylate kinase [Chloroflexia bacterium]|nr:adenylate kinase [Chloroflexia bacterium]
MILILLGAPGAGKGTQSEILSEQLQMPHVSSGDLLRDNRKRGTELGKVAEGYMDRGELVPDDLIIEMILDRLSLPDATHGVLLDGFPRTLPQAAALDEALDRNGKRVNGALYINVPEDVLLDRLSGRLTCRNCGHVYHEKFAPPKVSGVCDVCGGELYQREDDKRETAIKRLSVYFDQTRPIIGYYRDANKLNEVNGQQTIEKVTEDLVSYLR